MMEANAARSASAAKVQAAWITGLGELSRYGLPQRVQLAAELRRDHPDLALAELGDLMGITKHAYAGLIRRLDIPGP